VEGIQLPTALALLLGADLIPEECRLQIGAASDLAPDVVNIVSCCFGRIAPSNTATESRHAIRGNPETKLQAFRASDPEKLAISSQPKPPENDSRSVA